MACRIAVRTMGSPLRFTRRFNAILKLPCVPADKATSFPVSIKPQVEAFTNTEELLPRCDSQSASPSLSAISFSAVSSSGIRNRASARHINTTPSSEERSYSCMNASSTPCSAFRLRTEATRLQARSFTRSEADGSRRATVSNFWTMPVSSAK